MSSNRKNSGDSTNSLLSSVSSMTSFKSYDSNEHLYIKNEEKQIDSSNNDVLFNKTNKIQKSRKRDVYVNTPIHSPSIEKWEKLLKERNEQKITIEDSLDLEETLEF